MNNERVNLTELLKYPLTVFSILLALIVATHTLGIKFGVVSELSVEGIKFTQETKSEVSDLASKLNAALTAIEELKARTPSAQTPIVQAAIAEAAQTVSDQSAQFSRISPGSRQGYIFIGNYDNAWSALKLGALETGQPIVIAPGNLKAGTTYQVLGNMVVRDGLPANDSQYYQGRASLGTVPRGSKVRLISTPVGIHREFATQYWAQIEIP
ncbi:hypothetical protein [Pseudomonas sp. NMI760_13]|uniref:hypothetical protein n=1 Tax=Pseudomonas sp. NMI760_13 TaxID=2903147 RepID=UPI001E3EC59A|nr:hypothetical protein [Pseudomonas sp. NMI760_13]MCE0915664.1 hypothetical protein [Pseudomonas sp. NMI760_13]MDC0687591.1 hypothetical protein [Mitsuaria sp. RG]